MPLPSRTWLPALLLTAMALVTGGRATRGSILAPASFGLGPVARERFGVNEPFTLALPVALPASAVARSLFASEPVRVSRIGPDRYHIFPKRLWPADSRVRLRVKTARLSSRWPWPRRRLLDTLRTGPDVTVDVSLSTQEMAVYRGEELLRVIPVSTGAWPKYVTPTGRFYIFRRVRVETMTGGTPGTPGYYRVQHVPFSQYIFGGVAIHGAWWVNAFGEPRSHGCIQLPTQAHNPDPEAVQEEAGWLWSVTALGTPVTVTGTTPHVLTTPVHYPRA